MDGMPKVTLLPPGEMYLYSSIQGPILLNFQPAGHARPQFLQLALDPSGQLMGYSLAGGSLPDAVADGRTMDLGRFGFLNSPHFQIGKYVLFNDDRVALFPDTVTHANVPEWVGIGGRKYVVGAGFVEICTDVPASLGIRCHGESFSLERGSRRHQDAIHLARMIGLQHFEDD